MTLPPYRFASGDTHGEPDRTPAPASSYARITLAQRARLARRRKETDPAWASRSPESRRFFLDLDAKEQGR